MPPSPHLYMYTHSNELEEVGVISLSGVKVESSIDMATLLGVSTFARPHRNILTVYQKPNLFTLFTSSNSHVFSAPNDRELNIWISKLDPTRISTP